MKKLPAVHFAIFSIVAAAVSLSLPLYAAEPSSTMKIRDGAYVDTFGNADTVCVTKKTIETLSLRGWQEKMGQLGRTCSLSEPNEQSFINDSWKATCTSAVDASKNSYRISLSFIENKLTIDSMIKTAAGELKLKKAFQGEYKGACTSNTPVFDTWSYLDLPAPLSASELLARKSVAADMIRCGNVFNALALVVAKEKKSDMMTVAKAIWESALGLVDNDSDFYLRELKKSAEEVSATLIPLPSVEKRLEMVQACKKYTVPEGVADAVNQQTMIAR